MWLSQSHLLSFPQPQPVTYRPKVREGETADTNYSSSTSILQLGKPHVQGAVAAWVQEGREELLHLQGQEGWP